MNLNKPRRNRGVILTPSGWQKLQNVILELEFQENYGDKYTLEELSERSGVTSVTLSKVVACEEKVDKKTLVEVFKAFNLELNKNDYSQPEPDFESINRAVTSLQQDWGEAVDVKVFYGRTEELFTLNQWLLNEHCRIVALLGMGGVGKTSLSVKLAKEIQYKFEYVIWRSLHNAPPLKDILSNLIQFLSNGQETQTDRRESISRRISRLINYLRLHRCLIVLDNAETILRDCACVGLYREGYEDYSQLFRQIGEVSHQSCLVLTSREKPKEIAFLEGKELPVRSLQLNGLNVVDGQNLFRHKGLSGSKEEWKALIEHYAGNPSALKIVATTIQDVFDGNVTEFLQQNTAVFGAIYQLFEQQFDRLSDLEKEIMYWLAINREPISLSELCSDILSLTSQQRLLEGLESLRRRSLLETSSALFTLQPVVMDYVTTRLIDLVCEEIANQKIRFFRKYALIKSQSPYNVKKSQIRFILQPVINGLITIFKTKKNIENQLNKILAGLRGEFPLESGYTAGNILNLLCHLQTDLSGYDFSHLTVWQADLKGYTLHNVNFAHANLSKTAFTKTLSSIYSLAFSPDGKLLVAIDVNGEIWVWQVFRDYQEVLTYQEDTSLIKSSSLIEDYFTTNSDSTKQNLYLSKVSIDNFLKAFQENTDGVRTIAFSPDGQTFASACANRTVKLWDTSTGICHKTLQRHTSWVKSLAFSPKGNILASGSDDKTVKLWDISTGVCLKTLEHKNGVWLLAFNSKGNILVSSCDDQKMHVWDVSVGQCLTILQGHTDCVMSVAFSPQGNILATASKDKTIKLWNVNTGECLKTLQGHTGWVMSVAFSPDGNTLVSGGTDQNLKLWDVNVGKCLKNLEGHTHWIRSVTFNPDGNMLASGGEDQTVRFWDVLTGNCLGTLMNSKPYAGINITGVKGLTAATIASLKVLGAIELDDPGA